MPMRQLARSDYTMIPPFRVSAFRPIVEILPMCLQSSIKSSSDLAHWNGDTEEELTSLHTLTADVNGHSTALFCVGTVYNSFEEREAAKGRLLIFMAESQAPISPNLRLTLVTSEDVQGCVYALASVNGMVAAAINSSVIKSLFRKQMVLTFFQVVLFSLERTDMEATNLRKVTQWTHNYIVSSLVSYGDNLMLGDAISSVSILKLQGTQLQTVARDYGPLWPVCVQALDENSLIGSNVS
jgi:DNA damage-binding protein 1